MKAEENIYKQAFDVYGMDKNCGFLMEECGELMSAVNKLRRGRVDEESVIEELADTYQVLMAFAMHFGYDKFLLMLSKKQDKLAKALSEFTPITLTEQTNKTKEL